MTAHSLIFGSLGLASAALVALNFVRARTPGTTPVPPAPTAAAPTALAGVTDPQSPEAQLEAFRRRILDHLVVIPAPGSPPPSLLPTSPEFPNRPGMPVVTFPAPKVWSEFETNGTPFQINPLSLEIADAN